LLKNALLCSKIGQTKNLKNMIQLADGLTLTYEQVLSQIPEAVKFKLLNGNGLAYKNGNSTSTNSDKIQENETTATPLLTSFGVSFLQLNDIQKKPISHTIDLEELMREQNYRGVNWSKVDEIVAKVAWSDADEAAFQRDDWS
jgi:hypothetical protein